MTAPRQLLRGSTYHVTRRCLDRRYFLKPTVLTTQVLGYLLARAAARSKVRVHAYCFMSNHLHLVVTDPRAALPAFMEDLDSLVSRALNASLGRWGYFWEEGSYSATLLDAPTDILDACVYVLANPVRAGLVRRSRQWPGLRSLPSEVGEVLAFERPNHFFSKDGQQPELLTLQLATPPGWASAGEFGVELAAALAAREAAVAAAGTRFLGLARLRKLDPLSAPTTPEKRRAMRPRFAAKTPGRLRALAERLAIFLAEHREALLEWREGRRWALFPEGTYLMRVGHSAACASCAPGG
jgi:REP element-mobilizing transposase RayT